MPTIDDICAKANKLPSSPSVLPAIIQLLDRDDAGISDLETIISKDTALCAAVLKLANSAAIGSGQVFDSLSEAILRLGFKQTYQLVVSVGSGRWSSFNVHAYGWEPGDFCRHSFAVAVASRLIAKRTGAAEPELAYTAGLMHEAGKLALAFAASNELDLVRAYQEKACCDWLAAEQAILGFSHADVSGALLSSWNFPQNLVDVGRFYASPDHASPAFHPLVSIVHAGKHLAIQTGIGAGEDAFWTPLDQKVVSLLGIDESILQDQLPDMVNLLQKLLGKEIQTGAIHFS